jgi:hypothetical protein
VFGLFKKRQSSVLDGAIRAIYGDTPPAKTARLSDAIQIARELLGEVVDADQVAQVAGDLFRGPIPYSTSDLAASTALNFFKRSNMIGTLTQAQLSARIWMLSELQAGTLNAVIARTFEQTLCELYKPQHSADRSTPVTSPSKSISPDFLSAPELHYPLIEWVGDILRSIPSPDQKAKFMLTGPQYDRILGGLSVLSRLDESSLDIRDECARKGLLEQFDSMSESITEVFVYVVHLLVSRSPEQMRGAARPLVEAATKLFDTLRSIKAGDPREGSSFEVTYREIGSCVFDIMKTAGLAE